MSIRQRRVKNELTNHAQRTTPSLAGTSTSRADCVPGRVVKQRGERDGHYRRYKHCVWVIKTSVTQDPLAVHLLEVDALNVKEDMDLIPSIKFLAHNTGRRLSRIEGRLAGNGCSLRSKFPHQEICRWHEGGGGMFARRVGNLLQA